MTVVCDNELPDPSGIRKRQNCPALAKGRPDRVPKFKIAETKQRWPRPNNVRKFLLEGPFAVVFLLAGDVIAHVVRVPSLHRSRGSRTPALNLHVPTVEKPWAWILYRQNRPSEWATAAGQRTWW